MPKAARRGEKSLPKIWPDNSRRSKPPRSQNKIPRGQHTDRQQNLGNSSGPHSQAETDRPVDRQTGQGRLGLP